MRFSMMIGLTGLMVASAICRLAVGAADLAVLRLGDGVRPLGGGSVPFSIDYYDTNVPGQTTPAATVAVPFTGPGRLVLGGLETHEGALVRAPSGALTFAGYNAAPDVPHIVGTSSLAAPRAIGAVQGTTYSLAASFGEQPPSADYAPGEISAGATDAAGNYWGASASKGTILARGGGGANVVVQASRVNTRSIDVIGGDLYFSSMSLTKGIYSLGAASAATASRTPDLLIPTGINASPNEFAFSPSGTIAYVADDRPNLNFGLHTGAGIQRFDLLNGTWTLSYTLEMNAAGTEGARGLAVDWSGASPVLYASTNAANRIVRITDTGVASPLTTLATPGPNTWFLGVELIPEPAGVAALMLALTTLRRRRSTRA
jgi:hypothetical protein